MWSIKAYPATNSITTRYEMFFGDRALTYREALELFRDEADFRNQIVRTLQESPYSAFRWETPVVDDERVERPFEFVLVDSPRLAGTADKSAFASYFAKEPGKRVLSFRTWAVMPC